MYIVSQLGIPPSGSQADGGATIWNVVITRAEGRSKCDRLYMGSKSSPPEWLRRHSYARFSGQGK